MATAATPQPTRALEGERRFLLPGIGWEGYEALLKLIGDGRTRVTYDRGDAELMSPLYQHENFKKLFGRLIETLTEEQGIPCIGAGSTTWRKQSADRGLEPDECYYLANAGRVAGRLELDLTVDPPPDLAVEIEITRGTLDRMGVYAALGIPEVWRFDGDTLYIVLLQPDQTYRHAEVSRVLPAITADEVTHWIGLGRTMDHTVWGRQFRAWVRDEVLPRVEGR
jgi:Uma2 family endonuclease